MMHTKKASLFAAALVLTLGCVAAPQPAQAAFKLGVDGIWVPVATQQVESEGTKLDSSHDIASFGGALHGLIGFNIFSVGLKLNYFNQGLDVESEGTRRNEVDINAMARIGIPKTKIGIFGEGGAALSTDFEGLGYNFGAGGEYALFKIPVMKFNVGAEGQYVNLPADINGLETDSKSFRFLLFVGADFGF